MLHTVFLLFIVHNLCSGKLLNVLVNILFVDANLSEELAHFKAPDKGMQVNTV